MNTGNFAAMGNDSPKLGRHITYGALGQNTTPRHALLRGKSSDPDMND